VNNQQLRYAWMAVSVSLPIIAMWTGYFSVLVVAMFATFLTVGLKTGSLAPHFPTVTRTQRPVVFWIVMLLCASVVVANLLNLIRRL